MAHLLQGGGTVSFKIKINLRVEMEGMEELQRKLRKISEKVGPEKVSPILYDAAETITARIQANVNSINKVSGNLRDSPVTKQMSGSPNNPKPCISAIDRKVAPHAHLVEFGAKGGKIRAQPFFRTAWDSSKGSVKATLEGGIKKIVEQGVRV